MLLVFSHFFVPTMQLCPPGRSVLRPNTECYFPIPSPRSGPDDSPAPALQTPTAHTLPSRDRAQPTLPDPRRRHNLHPAEPHAQATAGEKQGAQTSTDDTSNPSRGWISSAPRRGSSWRVHQELTNSPHSVLFGTNSRRLCRGLP